jgi:hypothetical protein
MAIAGLVSCGSSSDSGGTGGKGGSGGSCPLSSTGDYAPKHNPMIPSPRRTDKKSIGDQAIERAFALPAGMEHAGKDC